MNPFVRLSGLAALNLLLLGGVLQTLRAPVDAAPAAPVTERLMSLRSEADPVAAMPAVAAAGTGEALLARPLFVASRQPWQPPAAPPAPVPVRAAPRALPPAPPPEPEPLLIGIEIANGNPTALLLSADSERSVWVAPGGMVGGWTVREISERAVTVEMADRRISLDLHVANADG